MLFQKHAIALSIATSLSLSLSLSALANNGNGNNNGNSQGDENGKPFQELRQLIDANRALIDANQSDISQLKTAIAQLHTIVDDIDSRMISLDEQASSNAQAIESALVKIDQNTTDLATLRTELTTTREQLITTIESLNAQVNALEGEVKDTVTQLETASAALTLKMQALELAIANNAIATDGLQVQMLSLISEISTLSAQATTLNWSYQQLQTNISDLEDGQIAIEQHILDLTEQIAAIGDGSGGSGPGTGDPELQPCFTLNNTGAIDITVASWFDRCVDAQGTKVKIVLTDAQGEVVYQAQGDKVGEWTYEKLTSTSAYSQHSDWNHGNKIALDDGAHLMITGGRARGRYCSSELDNGYFIRVVEGGSSIRQKLAVASYTRDGNLNGGDRKFYNWTPNNEISYNDGKPMTSCVSSASDNKYEPFFGKFEFYVLP